MKINWQTVSQKTFMNDYWQQRPIVLKNAITNFTDPIEADELAGLAMEEFIDSRLISNINNQWQVEHGPFTEFNYLPQENWSLLVQGVDRWFDQVYALRELVNFLPQWQIDDVMISYSMPKSGVGAHLDQYNVFIIQGQGSRRWQAGEVDKSLKQKEIASDLLQLDDFEPIVDEVLQPGDIIYIPPFSPHRGETITTALNYSIGFRAPSAQELLSEFSDHLIDNELGNNRYSAAETMPVSNTISSSTLLNSSEINNLKQLLITQISKDENFIPFIHQYLTRATRELDLIEDEITPEQLQLLDYVSISKTRAVESAAIQLGHQQYFICNGETFYFNSEQADFVKLLLSNSKLTKDILKSSKNSLENNQLLTKLINHGYWYIEYE